MLVELFNFFSDSYGPLRVFDYLSFRAIFATLTALFVSLILGPRFINKMQEIQVGQVVREVGPASHLTKRGTPTMGGTLILSSIVISSVLWGDLENRYLWVALGVTTLFGLLGWVDDLYKLRFESSKGLSPLSKILWQSLITLAAVTFLYYSSENINEISLIVPFLKNISFPLGIGFIFVSYVVIIGSSNAVNLTDGLDGLAILPCVMVAGGLGLIGYAAGNTIYAEYLNIPFLPGTGEMLVFCGALVGAGIGFLWYNTYPASIFMGDTGSLTVGALIAVISILIRKELMIPLLCGIFLIEALSVIIQVSYFKMTKKKTGIS